MRRDGSSRLVVLLQPDDMTRLDITFERFDYRNEETRKIISQILTKAREEQSFDSHGKRLTIEVFPADGGCEIVFEAAERDLPPESLSGDAETYILRFSESEPLYAMLELTGERIRKCTLSAALYCLGRDYFVVFLASAGQAGRLRSIVSEFGDFSHGDKQSVARLDEYGKLLLVSRDLSRELLKNVIKH